MEYVTKGLAPQVVLEYFEQLSQIPRGSGNEEAAADFVFNFAKEKNLDVVRDKANNVLIRKKASAGYEDKPAVLMQGHLDMVCEKNASTEHDFMCDPIKVKVENGWLTADGTTLGGDDGAAVAMMMAVLSDDTLQHPDIECLFTTDEEKGMTGARAFDCSQIKSRRMINLDSEDERIAVISSAGGERTNMRIVCEGIPAKNKFVRIKIGGLTGGHSGNEINANRTNAIRAMGSLLSYLYDVEPFEICSIDGGGLDNAIPRECTAILSVLDLQTVKDEVKKWEKSIRVTLSKADKGFYVHISKNRIEQTALTYKDTRRVISLIVLSPNGALSMSDRVNGLVESSSNIGSVKTKIEDTRVTVSTVSLYRTCVDALLDDIARRFDLLGKLLECEVEHTQRYSGWLPKTDSPLQKLYLEKYRELFGREAKLEAIHAGLECGLISAAIPDMDIISIGPDMCDIHSPDERMSIESLDRTYKLLLLILRA